MRVSFTRVLRAVAALAAVSGSVFASFWLVAIKPEPSKAPRVAAGSSSTIVHASLPARHARAAPRSALVVVTSAVERVAAGRARSRSRATRKAVTHQVAPASRAGATKPAARATTAKAALRAPAGLPTSPAPTPTTSAQTSYRKHTTIETPTAPATGGNARGGTGKPGKPSGATKADSKQAGGKKADGRQTNDKAATNDQAVTKQASDQNPNGSDGNGQGDEAKAKGNGKP